MTSVQPLLQIKNLTKYYGTKKILDNVNLDVYQGEVIVLLGSSGCGKSTLLRCLNGLETINSGDILLNGKSILSNHTKWSEIRQKVGMVFQNYELFPHLNVLDNILLGPLKVQHRNKQEVLQQAYDLLDKVNLRDKQFAYPSQLSGGQKQRIAIIRALCMNPELLLLDEITASLDPEMVREVLEVVLQLAKNGMTMLIVTHELNFARAVSDHIIFLDNQAVLENTPSKEFFQKPKTARAKQFLDNYTYLSVS